ncbi:MAG: N-acetylglucosamine-6-phosphate deacetylase [Sporomusaceae bacterium]|nr:N-acetylglucosamine-6-phosphate deacetylase [Sporomusaceae bacterium]
MKHLISDCRLVLPDREFDGSLLIHTSQIMAIEEKISAPSDAKLHCFDGDFIIPGLIDTHVHGAGGFDVMDGTKESLDGLRHALLTVGTTAFLATTISSPLEQLYQALHTVQAASHSNNVSETASAELIGVHLEGPLLSTAYKGSHIPEYITPPSATEDCQLLTNILQTFPNLVRLITAAPERPGSKEFALLCRRHQIIAAAGHTSADYNQMQQAACWGFSRLTHSFNAMPGIHHRQPGPITATLLHPDIEMEIIADGVHVHPAVIETALRLKSPEKITLISDGTRAVAMPDGEYELGGQRTFVSGGMARLADGTIAGSAYPLLQGVRTLVNTLGHSLSEAVRFASLNPAKRFKLDHRLGSLECGKEATFLRLDKTLQLKEVWVQGQKIYEKKHAL